MSRVLLAVIFLIMPLQAVLGQTILIVGDSISSAYGMPVEQGWVALLQQRLRQQSSDKVVNLSISGDTSANAAARLPQALEQYQPHILLLEIGGNDGLRGQSLQQLQQNLESMIQLALSKQSKIMLLGIQLPPNYGPRYTEQFGSIYRQLAEQYKLTLLPSIVDGIGGKPELMQADGIHPNAQAQPMMLELVWPGLAQLLADG